MTELRTVEGTSRVVAAELFASATVFDVVWRADAPLATLMPIAAHRETAWLRCFAPMPPAFDGGGLFAAVHPHAIAYLAPTADADTLMRRSGGSAGAHSVSFAYRRARKHACALFAAQ